MGFLAPALLAALAALAVPIVLHLLQRERNDVVPFPSLMFLRQVPQETTQRRRLRHWLLLAARCAVLALLAFAFARPFLRGAAGAAAGERGARDVVVLLDRSASMGFGDRWQRAVRGADAVIGGLGADDRLTLVAFDAGAEALNEATGDRVALRALLNRARPGAGATRYGPALRLAQGVLEDSDRARREVVVVSDFQRAGWDGAPDVRLPAGTVLTKVDLSAAGPNAGIVGVDIGRDMAPDSATTGRVRRAGSGESVVLTARVRNYADGASLARTITLELNGRTLQTVSVDLPANDIVPVRFDAVALPPDAARGVVRLAADGLRADDAHHFVVSRAQRRPAIIVEPAGATAAASLYLTRALALARDPAYDVAVHEADALRTEHLEGAALVILNDVPPPTGSVGERLAELVRGGAGVVAVLGDRSSRWSGPLAELAPLSIGDVRDRRPAGDALGYVDRTHPVFAPFRTARGGDFSAARTFRYRELRPADGTAVLARHGDGSPALVEIPVERGRVLVWASALDNRWSDLPVQPVFLPLVHELARHAAGRPPSAPALTVGERVDVARYAALHGGPAAETTSSAGWLAVAPSGARTRLGGAAGLALEPREAGFYQLRSLEADARPQPLAVNVDPAEGDLTPLDSAAFTVATADGAANAAGVAMPTAAEQEGRQALWWWLLAGALLLLGAEAAYANRLSVRTR